HLDILRDLLHTADEHVRILQEPLRCCVSQIPLADVVFSRLPAIICHGYQGDKQVQFQCIEPLSCRLAHPLHLLCKGSICAFPCSNGPLRVHFDMHAYNLCLSRGKRKEPFTSAANEKWWMWVLNRLRETFQVVYLVRVTRKRDRLIGEETLDNLDSFFQATDTHSSRFKWQTYLFVLGPVPSGADAKLQAPA